MDLLRIARTPPVTIGPRASVLDAVELMSDAGAGAVIVVDDGKAVGIFTASDLLRRVVAKGRRLDITPLADVATLAYGGRRVRSQVPLPGTELRWSGLQDLHPYSTKKSAGPTAPASPYKL